MKMAKEVDGLKGREKERFERTQWRLFIAMAVSLALRKWFRGMMGGWRLLVDGLLESFRSRVLLLIKKLFDSFFQSISNRGLSSSIMTLK